MKALRFIKFFLLPVFAALFLLGAEPALAGNAGYLNTELTEVKDTIKQAVEGNVSTIAILLGVLALIIGSIWKVDIKLVLSFAGLCLLVAIGPKIALGFLSAMRGA